MTDEVSIGKSIKAPDRVLTGRARAVFAVAAIACGWAAVHAAGDGLQELRSAAIDRPAFETALDPAPNAAPAETAAPADALPHGAASRSFAWAAIAGAGALVLGAFAGLGGAGKAALGAAVGLAKAGAAAVVASAKGFAWLGRTGVRRALLLGASVFVMGAVGAAAGGGGVGSLLGAAVGVGAMLGVLSGASWLRRKLADFDAGFDAVPI